MPTVRSTDNRFVRRSNRPRAPRVDTHHIEGMPPASPVADFNNDVVAFERTHVHLTLKSAFRSSAATNGLN